MHGSPRRNVAVVMENAYSTQLRELFIFEAGLGLRITSARHVTLDNVSIYGKGRTDSVGAEITDSVVSAFNINIESVSDGLVVRGTRGQLGGVSLFGGYIERFGNIGILVEGAQGTSAFGTVVVAQADRDQTPVVIRGGKAGAGACSGNVFIGGAYEYEAASVGRRAFRVAPDCPGNTIAATQATGP
jgi:hypothetical protein